MYYTKELKLAIKKLKEGKDFAYQVGVNDTLDLLDEMADSIILDNVTHEPTQVITQQTKQESAPATNPTLENPSTPQTENGSGLDFSGLEALTKELNEHPVPQPIKLEIPQVSSQIMAEDLLEKQVESKPITEHPVFMGWGNSDEDDEEEFPVRTHEAAEEFEQQTAQQSVQEMTQEPDQEVAVEEPPHEEPVPISPEEQEKLAKAQLLAEAKAQALRDAQENDDDEEDYD